MDVLAKFFQEHVIILLVLNGMGFSMTIYLVKKYIDGIFSKMDELGKDVKESLNNHNTCKIELPNKFVTRDEFQELKRDLRDFREEICGFIRNLEKDRANKWNGYFHSHRHTSEGIVYFPYGAEK